MNKASEIPSFTFVNKDGKYRLAINPKCLLFYKETFGMPIEETRSFIENMDKQVKWQELNKSWEAYKKENNLSQDELDTLEKETNESGVLDEVKAWLDVSAR